jgi:hypothetical protein
MSEKLNLFCKNCELSWDDIEIKTCPNCSHDDIIVVQTIDSNNKSYKYLILPIFIFIGSVLFISTDSFNALKTNLIEFVFQKDKVLIEDNDGLGNHWLPEYYGNGQLKQEGESLNGRRNGLWTTYYMNGEIESMGLWKEDIKNGLWKYFRENGLLKFEEQWKDGRIEEVTSAFSEENAKKTAQAKKKEAAHAAEIRSRVSSDKTPEEKKKQALEQASDKEKISKTTIYFKSVALPKTRILDDLPVYAIVSPDGKYLYFNVGSNPFTGFIFDLKKKELVGEFKDKGSGLMSGKAFYDKKDDKLFFKCKRILPIGENYIVDLDNADGYTDGFKLGRKLKSWVNHNQSKGYQEVATQELGKVYINGSTFNDAVRLNNKSVVQIKLDRVVIIQ